MDINVLSLKGLPHGTFLYLYHLMMYPGLLKYLLAMQALSYMFVEEQVNFHFAD